MNKARPRAQMVCEYPIGKKRQLLESDRENENSRGLKCRGEKKTACECRKEEYQRPEIQVVE